jgi:hypothetical protein
MEQPRKDATQMPKEGRTRRQQLDVCQLGPAHILYKHSKHVADTAVIMPLASENALISQNHVDCILTELWLKVICNMSSESLMK